LTPLVRPLATAAGLIMAWWALTRLTAVPPYMLPGPSAVASALWTQRVLLFRGALTTGGEVAAGLLIGVLSGGLFGLLVVLSPVLRRWLMPLLLISQAMPVFALAPLLVLWFGFGMASKIVMAVLVIFFPVTAALADGLRRTEQGLVDLAVTMNASPMAILWHVRLPAALPSFGSGLRIAAVVAPIGAIIGEWVGASAGLGYVMLNANARMETDVMFAALFILSAMTILLWVGVDLLLTRLLAWAPDTSALSWPDARSHTRLDNRQFSSPLVQDSTGSP
jgi:putative hydroxymethylpyrimidine transport system permease protein